MKKVYIIIIVVIVVAIAGVIYWFFRPQILEDSKGNKEQYNYLKTSEEVTYPVSYHIENPPYYSEKNWCWGSCAMMLMMDYGLTEQELQELKTVLKSGRGGPPDIFMGFQAFGVNKKARIAYLKDYVKENADFYNEQLLVNPQDQTIILDNQKEALNLCKKLVSQDTLVMVLIHYGNHYVIVTGYDEGSIYIYDPGFDDGYDYKGGSFNEKTKMAEDSFLGEWNIKHFEGGGVGFPGDCGMIWLEK